MNLILRLETSQDLIKARLAARQLAASAGLGAMDQTRFATAVSELGRNALTYGVGGQCALRDASDDRRIRVEVEVTDSGPGIPDIEHAMQDGYSTGGSLGAGLPGTRRLVDVFEIHSSDQGTTVRVQVARNRRT